MITTLKTVSIALLVFGLGVLSGMWTERRIHDKERFQHPLPMGEFGPDDRWHHHHEMRPPPDFQEKMDQLRPQIEAYQQKVHAIEETFSKKVEAVLRPEQKTRLDEVLDQSSQSFIHNSPSRDGSTSENRLGEVTGEPRFVGLIVYKPLLDRLTTQLSLDASQQKTVEQLLRERRDQILLLVDTTPPPTLHFR